MRRFMRVSSYLLLVVWVVLAVVNPHNNWFRSDPNSGWVRPGGPFLWFDRTPFEEQLWDLGGLVALTFAGLGLALPQKNPKRQIGWIVGGIGLASIAIGFFGGYWDSIERGESLAKVSYGGNTDHRKKLAQTIVGYHYLAPVEGGTAAFGDGAVLFVSKNDFEKAIKPTISEDASIWKSPVKEPSPPKLNPDEKPSEAMLRRTRERSVIGSDLKTMVTAVYNAGANSPKNPDELTQLAKLDNRQKGLLEDGTYVWSYGWTAQDLEGMAAHKKLYQSMHRFDLLSWLGFHLCGLGMGLFLFGFMSLVRTKKTPKIS